MNSVSPLTPVRIRPETGWSVFNVAELWRHRDVLLMLALRDIKLRYRQTALGVIWVVLQPLLAGTIFAIVFGRFAGLPLEGPSYFASAFAALIGWQLFAGILQRAGGSLVQEARLITKVYFPRVLVPLSGACSALVDFTVAAAVMVVILFAHGLNPGAALLWLPVALGLTLALAVGVSLWLAALNVRYRDFMHATPFLIQVWMFASPVVYGSAVVPERWRGWFECNPLVGVIELFRAAWLGTTPPSVRALLISAAFALAMIAGGLLLFRAVERDMAERL
jgi:lipopolysaccharide transport system permease protein